MGILGPNDSRRARRVSGHEGQAAQAPLPGPPRPGARQVPVRRGRRGRDRRVLHRRLPPHARQGDPAGPSDAVRRGPARHRGEARSRHAAPELGTGHAHRDRGPGVARPAGSVGLAPCAAPGDRAVASDGPGAADGVRAGVLPPGARRRGRLAAGGRPVAPRVRHRHVRRPRRRDRRHRDRGARHRVPRGELVQRVRQRRLRGEHQVRRRHPRRRRGVPVQAARPRGVRAARQARHVPGPAARRSRWERPARELLVPSRRRLERVPRSQRPRGFVGSRRGSASRGCWRTTRAWPRSWRPT